MSALLYVPRTRLIWMDMPTAENAAALAAELEDHHGRERVIVWNVAGSGEETYTADSFGRGCVVALRYPGHLCPPVLMLVEACASIHAWLRADPANFVAVHCRMGRGRSAVLLACVAAFLAVRGEHEGPMSPVDWLSHLAQLRAVDEHTLTLPTHRRYLKYFEELLTAGPPSGADHAGCELRAVTLHAFPRLSTPPHVALSTGTRTMYASTDAVDMELPDADAEPYERVAYAYRGASAPKAVDPPAGGGAAHEPAWPLLRGDVVLTIREQGRSGPLLCRLGFHVDFAAAVGVLRVPMHDTDGGQSRLPADAFVDIVLAARTPPVGTAGPGGMLGPAVLSLRRAGVATAIATGDQKAKAAFGGARQPVAKFSFGEDEEEVTVTMPAPGEAPKRAPQGHTPAAVAKQSVSPPPAPPPALPLPTVPLPTVPTAVNAKATTSQPSAPPAAATAPPAASTAPPALSPLELLSKYTAGAPAPSTPTPPPPPLASAEPISSPPSVTPTPVTSASGDDVEARVELLMEEARQLRAAGDKQGAVVKVREMKALQAQMADASKDAAPLQGPPPAVGVTEASSSGTAHVTDGGRPKPAADPLAAIEPTAELPVPAPAALDEAAPPSDVADAEAPVADVSVEPLSPTDSRAGDPSAIKPPAIEPAATEPPASRAPADDLDAQIGSALDDDVDSNAHAPSKSAAEEVDDLDAAIEAELLDGDDDDELEDAPPASSGTTRTKVDDEFDALF